MVGRFVYQNPGTFPFSSSFNTLFHLSSRTAFFFSLYFSPSRILTALYRLLILQFPFSFHCLSSYAHPFFSLLKVLAICCFAEPCKWNTPTLLLFHSGAFVPNKKARQWCTLRVNQKNKESVHWKTWTSWYPICLNCFFPKLGMLKCSFSFPPNSLINL